MPPAHLHEPFLDRAANAHEPDSSDALGAFLTMRLVDQFTKEVEPPNPTGLQYQIRATRDFLEERQPLSGEAERLLAIVREAPAAHEAACPRLLFDPVVAFARWLEDEDRLDEAQDVLATALRLVGASEREEQVATHLHLGRILRQLNRLEEAQHSYAVAERTAHEIGDLHSQLLARVGYGIMLRESRQYGKSREMLSVVISQAVDAGDRDAEARARHELALTLADDRQPARAVRECMAAVELYEDADRKLRALSDLGGLCKSVGQYSAAQDAYELVLAGAAPSELRASAMLTLLELSALRRDRISFARWRKELEAMAQEIAPALPVDLALTLASGFARFQQTARATALLNRAARQAEQHGMKDRVARANSLLQEIEQGTFPPPGTGAGPPDANEPELRELADRLHALRGT